MPLMDSKSLNQYKGRQKETSKALSNCWEVHAEYRGEGHLIEGVSNDIEIFDPSLQLLPLFCIREEKGAH